MSAYFIATSHFNKFVNQLIQQFPVFAPTAVENYFSFTQLESARELRLDYDLTLLPPKKVFFPPEQVILEFKEGKFEGTVNAKKQVLLGVHPYDLRAIEQTDLLFTENYEDINYTAYRNATTIVGSNIQTVAKRAFWSSINNQQQVDQQQGHDAFLTYLIDASNSTELDGYLFEVFTDKGQDLLSYGEFELATDMQCEQALLVIKSINKQCPQTLNFSADEIAQVLKNSFSHIKLWDELAEDCFSCGSCNTTCPTCYCFNIEDSWNVDQISGQRTRYWDSCMTEDFAKISSASGHSENFRPTTGSRMRHRMMRKMVYLNTKLGSQACVGCGRCSIACTADIADPIIIINKLMEASHGAK